MLDRRSLLRSTGTATLGAPGPTAVTGVLKGTFTEPLPDNQSFNQQTGLA
ncbi:hypothetical protein [Streptomyces sp. NPDC008092]